LKYSTSPRYRNQRHQVYLALAEEIVDLPVRPALNKLNFSSYLRSDIFQELAIVGESLFWGNHCSNGYTQLILLGHCGARAGNLDGSGKVDNSRAAFVFTAGRDQQEE
ncbi:MAG: hypothetical protein WC712_14780, partial [Candidatus Brocadiia bacterium]